MILARTLYGAGEKGRDTCGVGIDAGKDCSVYVSSKRMDSEQQWMVVGDDPQHTVCIIGSSDLQALLYTKNEGICFSFYVDLYSSIIPFLYSCDCRCCHYPCAWDAYAAKDGMLYPDGMFISTCFFP